MLHPRFDLKFKVCEKSLLINIKQAYLKIYYNRLLTYESL